MAVVHRNADAAGQDEVSPPAFIGERSERRTLSASMAIWRGFGLGGQQNGELLGGDAGECIQRPQMAGQTARDREQHTVVHRQIDVLCS